VPVPFFDLTRQARVTGPAVEAAVARVFASQQFILGRTVSDFEDAFCRLTGCAHAVGMSSGTDAQLAILMALGIGPGDAVITTPYTFFATAGCIARVGATPVFVDVLPDTLHIDPAAIEAFLATCRADSDGTPLTPAGARVRAIAPVHLFGSVCRMSDILAIAARHGLAVTEDSAQAVGAGYQTPDGYAQAGNIAPSAWFSFFPTKNLGGAGDGGMAVCKDPAFAERLRRIRNHGMDATYHHTEVGGNFRLDAIQAAVLEAKIPHLASWNDARRRNAALYRDAFTSRGLLDFLVLPSEPHAPIPGHHTYHQYVVRAKDRDLLKASLAAAGIGHAVYYPTPLHLQPCFASLGYQPGDLPVSEAASRDSLALPIFPELGESEIAQVADAIAAFYRG